MGTRKPCCNKIRANVQDAKLVQEKMHYCSGLAAVYQTNTFQQSPELLQKQNLSENLIYFSRDYCKPRASNPHFK